MYRISVYLKEVDNKGRNKRVLAGSGLTADEVIAIDTRFNGDWKFTVYIDEKITMYRPCSITVDGTIKNT